MNLENSLFSAVVDADVVGVRAALEAGANCNYRVGSNTMLHVACNRGHADIAKILIESGAEIDARCGAVGGTPLHWAVGFAASAECARVLLRAGADPNARTTGGATPLHCAANVSSAELIAVLLEGGADVHARAAGGATALHYAARDAGATVVELLIEAGADLHSADDQGWLPIRWCSLRYSFDADWEVEELLDPDPDDDDF